MATDIHRCSSVPSVKTSKPALTIDDLKSLLCQRYGIQTSLVKEYPSYDDRTYYVKVAPGYEIGKRAEFIAKVMNSQFTAVEGAVAVQSDILIHLKSFPKLCCQVNQPNLDGNMLSYEMIPNDFRDGDVFIERKPSLSALRLFHYMPGKLLKDASPLLPEFFFEVGEHLGRLQQALQEYSGDIEPLKLKSAVSIWSLPAIPRLRHYVPVVADAGRRRLVEAVLDQFEARVLPVINELRQGIIYQDYNRDNVLVTARPDNGLRVIAAPCLNGASNPASGQNEDGVARRTRYRISGLIDFDDTVHSCLVYEIAIGMMYMMFTCDSPVAAAAYMLTGFETVAPLRSDERDLLKVLVACRFAQSLLISSFQMKNHPDNAYVSSSLVEGWSLLETWWNQTESQLQELWDTVKASRSCENGIG